MNTHVLKDYIDEKIFSDLDKLEEVSNIIPEKVLDSLKDMHDEVRDLGYKPLGFQERYEEVYMKAYNILHPEEQEQEEEEEYAILFDSKDGYSCPWFNDENTEGVQEIRFYPDRDSRLYIMKDGSEYWTD